MPRVEDHLHFALAQLGHEKTQLEKALDLAIALHYDTRWVHALDKALLTNYHAALHLQNVLANIRHPSQRPSTSEPYLVRPGRP